MAPLTRTRTAAACADELFLLPASGFFSDEAGGAGHVHLPDEFFALEPQCQMAILAGWRKGVDETWLCSLVHQFRTHYGDEANGPLPERLERFRREFAIRGIEVPADFALALQRY